MSGPTRTCAKCRHFQRYRPVTQLIARDVGAIEPGLVSELTRLMQDERQKQDAEAEQRLELLRIERVEWPARPAMSDYCALREAEGMFLLYEVKNPDDTCGDYQDGPIVRKECKTCAAYMPQQGEAQTRAMLQRYREMQNLAGAAGETGDQGMVAYLNSVGGRQAFEAAQAYYFERFSVSPPQYLPVCGHFSTANDFVPCAVANRHDRCAAWRPVPSSTPRAGLFAEAVAAPRRPTT